MARADKTNGERELKLLPDTLSGGDLWFLGSVLGSHQGGRTGLKILGHANKV